MRRGRDQSLLMRSSSLSVPEGKQGPLGAEDGPWSEAGDAVEPSSSAGPRQLQLCRQLAPPSHHPPTHLCRSHALRVVGLPPARSLTSINTSPKDSGFICFSWRGSGGAGVPPSPPLLCLLLLR